MAGEVPTKRQDEMFCSSCGVRNKIGVQFCPECGARLGAAPEAAPPSPGGAVGSTGAVCSMCKREVMTERRFCHWCGQFLLKADAPLRAAGFGRRLGALLLDGLVGGVILIIGSILDAALGTFPLLYILAALGWLGVLLFFWAQGQSPAKAMLGMRVLDVTGNQAGFWKMVLRETIGKFVSGLVLYLGYLWVLWDKDQQGWHDKIANTIVVHEG